MAAHSCTLLFKEVVSFHMLPHELRDSSLIGIIRHGDSRTLVTPLGPYVSAEHQVLIRDRTGVHWQTTGGGDFFDANEADIQALRAALEERNKQVNPSKQPNLP